MKTAPLNIGVRTLFYMILAVFVVIQVYPIFWVIISSFKTQAEVMSSAPYSLPGSFYLGNYVSMLQNSQIPTYFMNSSIVAVLTLFFTIVIGAPAAFAIEKMKFGAGNQVLAFFLLGIMIPIFVTLLPMFQIYNALGLRNTFTSLILPQVGFNLPICIYLYSGFMRYVPNSLIESAHLDGAGSFKIFTSIILPMSKNTTITIITFNFIFIWNEFIFANTFMTSSSMKTLPLGLKDFVGLYGFTDWGATYAAITVTILPTLLIYFILNKSVIEGMAAGAVKS
ncbi:carbohydrate ABC transporter permease [Paenibacillus abyssi]|uniref:ABC transporter permease n=1 Tax=Paenibacillus abyssi TaxID=1340531 RepID=A0A917CZB7_9BACL|nr:carbohydrate ABC transporter permease [Paenibacillus abyssi]GGG00836.1 ABC transporter permease [Paenibacillus abyssi]